MEGGAAHVLETVEEANPPFSFLNPTLNLGNSLLSVNLSLFIFPNINNGMVSELHYDHHSVCLAKGP
jgi:hypothetical protein